MKFIKSILTLIALSLTCSLFAADTPFMGSFRQFTGGLNNTSSPLALPKESSPYMLNMDEDNVYGSLTSRKGSLICGNYPTSNPVINMYTYVTSAGSQYIIATDGTSIYATPDCASWINIASGLPIDKYEFSTVNNKLWIVSQSTSVITWDTSNTIYLDSSNTYAHYPHSKHITYWNSRVWLANTAEKASSVYFSVLVDTSGAQIDPTLSGAYSSLYQLYINPNDGGKISAIVPYNGYLYVFKDTGIWRVTFQDEYNLTISQQISTIGCVSGKTVVEYNGVLYFLSSSGIIYSFNGSIVQQAGPQIKKLTQLAKQPIGGYNTQSYNTDIAFSAGTTTGDSLWVGDNIFELWSSSVPSAELSWPQKLSQNSSDINYAPLHTVTKSCIDPLHPADDCSQYVELISTHDLRNIPSPSFYLWVSTFSNAMSADMLISSVSTNPSAYGNARVMFSSATSSGWYNPGAVTQVWYQTLTACFDSTCKHAADLRVAGQGAPNGDKVYTVTAKLYSDKTTNTIIDSKVMLSSATLASENYGVISVQRNGNLVFSLFSDDAYQKLETSATIVNSYNGDLVVKTELYTNLYVFHASIYDTNAYVYIPFGDLGHPTTHEATWTSAPFYASDINEWASQSLSATNTYGVATSTMEVSVRYGSSIADLETRAYEPFVNTSSMAVSSSLKYGQVKVHIIDNAPTVSDRVRIDNIGITWKYGNSSITQPSSFIYNDKMWLAISTSNINGYNDTLIKFSIVPNYHYSVYDLPCNSLLLFGANPYCAQPGNSAIKRFDTGTSDDGTPIHFEWQSGDQLESAPFYPKYGQYLLLDYLATDSILFNYGYSIDQGKTWTDYSETSSGSNQREIHRYNHSFDNANQYRVRVYGDSTTPVTIYGINVIGYIRDVLAE